MKNIIKRMTKKILIVISLLLTINIICSIPYERPTFADSGFSTSYDSGGSSFSSGSSWSSGSSSSWSSSNDSWNNDGKIGNIEIIILIISIIIGIIMYIARPADEPKNITPNIQLGDDIIEKEIKKYIPNFNKEQFLNEGYKMYCDIQEAWMNFKLEDVRNIITDELYSMYESQLSTLEVKGEQNVMKDFILRRSFLKDVVNENDTITVSTGYIIEFYDYIAEKETGKVLRGTDKRKMRVTYEMKFRKTLDQQKKVEKCPNCGAEIDMNSAGICSYCHTKLVTENTKWVLTEKTVKNQELV